MKAEYQPSITLTMDATEMGLVLLALKMVVEEIGDTNRELTDKVKAMLHDLAADTPQFEAQFEKLVKEFEVNG